MVFDEDGLVGLEGRRRARLLALLEVAQPLDGGDGRAAFIALLPYRPVAPDLDLHPLRQSIDGRRADAVEAAGDLVGGVVELAAGVQAGMHDLQGRDLLGRMLGHGDAEAVVGHADTIIGVNGHLDTVAAAGQGFVDGVIDDFVGQVVERLHVRAADVHARPAAHGFQSLQDLNVAGIVVGGC